MNAGRAGRSHARLQNVSQNFQGRSQLHMSSTTPRLIADGLWHCLCPSYSSVSLSTSRNALIRSRRPALQCAASRISSPAATRRNSTVAPVRFKGTVDAPLELQNSGLPVMNVWAPLDEETQSKRAKPGRTALRLVRAGKLKIITRDQTTSGFPSMDRFHRNKHKGSGATPSVPFTCDRRST